MNTTITLNNTKRIIAYTEDEGQMIQDWTPFERCPLECCAVFFTDGTAFDFVFARNGSCDPNFNWNIEAWYEYKFDKRGW